MVRPIKLIKRWLNRLQSSLKLPWVKVPQSFIQSQDQTLPAALTQKLAASIQNLPVPTVQIEQVAKELEQAIQRWQEYDNMLNVLVVLTEPVQPTDELLIAVFDQISQEHANFKQLHVERLDHWSERPNDHTIIKETVADAIAEIVKAATAADTAKLLVVPSLERYFLRCVDGLEAIEAIRQAIVDHPDCFWLVGCNRWAWHYLDKVCYLSAYLESSFELPGMSALELRHWLTPLDQVAELAPFPPSQQSQTDGSSQDGSSQDGSPQPGSDKSLEDLLGWRSSDEELFFRSIEQSANGVAPIAAASWLHSLRHKLVDPAAENAPQHPDGSETLGEVKRGKVLLPDIPSLEADRRFLLYAILLHGSLSSHHLAFSLAEPEGKVQAELQSLQRQNLIERKPYGWAVNPAYFPSLKRDLKRNNFLLG